MTIVDIKLDFKCDSLKRIIEILSIQDEEVRIVGGAVRDNIIGIKATDIDLVTTLSPKNSLKLLRNAKIATIPTGIKFGTITAYLDGKNFEITTLREDTYCDGRHAKVLFTKDFQKDAERRDFTINAMSYDVKSNKLYDYFNGYEDLQNKIVQFIGITPHRIEEDFLRILRFLRFSAKYANQIDKKGLLSCVEKKQNLQRLSPERIIRELNKILQSNGSAQILNIMHKHKIFEEISKDLEWDIDAYESFLQSAPRICNNISEQLEMHYVALLHKK